MDGKTAQRLAAKIAHELFMAGNEEQTVVERLILSQDGDEYGGWSEAAAARHIEKILLAEPTPKATK